MPQRGVFLCGLALLGTFAVSASAFADEDAIDYVQDIKPILARRCYSCHGALQQKNGLRVDTAKLAIKGGSAGEAIVPGKVDDSLLIDAVTGAEGVKKMPPEGDPLTEEQIAKLKKWIAQGAKHPAEEKVPEDPAKHWSYQVPVRPAVPAAKNSAWVRNPIDAFVAAEHEKRGLKPAPEAAKYLLLRRVYIDLIGLPPTRAELQAFLADQSPDAYEKVVDKLLASPHYGERWGRHWMDVWRYSDWDGYGAEVRESQPHIWRWRDWIIESVNADKPYDRMIVEMLAGDEVAPDDPNTIRATGFLVRNWYKFSRNVWLDFSIEHTAKGFLGVTMNCARCHDHMYDPIAQDDYYQFRAFFEPHTIRTDRVPGQMDTTKDGLARIFDQDAAAPTYLFARGNDKDPVKDKPLAPGLPTVFVKGGTLKVDPVALSPNSYYPGSRPHEQEEVITQAKAELTKAESGLKGAQAKLMAVKQQHADLLAAKPTETEKKPAPVVVFSDDFSAAKPEIWTMGEGQWEYKDGRLLQKDPRDALTQVLSVKTHPADFVGKFKFKTTGGDVYKSVGLSFDASEDKDLWGVYLSGVNKLAIFRRVNGQDQYFNDGIKDLTVELNREYELQVAVRGSLMNISVDGKLQMVYKLPGERRKEGRFACWTYDATAEFLRASVEELPANVPLYEKMGDAPVAVTAADLEKQIRQAEGAAALAEKVLATAQQAFVWTENRVAADKANYAVPPGANAKELSLAAGTSERVHAFRLAEQKLLEAEQKLAAAREALKPDDEKLKKAVTDAEAALTAATKARDDAQAGSTQPTDAYTRFGPMYPTSSTGRRLALARWIADRNNPLTARVAVNHIWLRHFGSALVPTVFDFGLNGKKPTHPELLDWLAAELMDGGWKMRSVHRLIVTSAAYRQASTNAAGDSNKAADPDNLFLWRANVRRMEAEAVRDSTLHIAGSLDKTMHGPEIDQNAGMTNSRRSIYFRNSKEKKMTFMEVFDRPNVVECYRRSESIVPQQALAMANSPLALAQSRVLAGKLSKAVGEEARPETVSAFITTAFEEILSRGPTSDERAECEKFIADQTQRFGDAKSLTAFTAGTPVPVAPSANPHLRARENLVHVLFNHNDFLTVR